MINHVVLGYQELCEIVSRTMQCGRANRASVYHPLWLHSHVSHNVNKECLLIEPLPRHMEGDFIPFPTFHENKKSPTHMNRYLFYVYLCNRTTNFKDLKLRCYCSGLMDYNNDHINHFESYMEDLRCI